MGEGDGELVDSQATLPREPANEFADIATTEAGARAAWQRFNLTGRPPPVDFDTTALLFVGFGESGSCPARFDGIAVDGGRVHVEIGSEGGTTHVTGEQTETACTSDYNARTFVVEVAHDVLPDSGFEVDVRGRTFVLSSEPLPEPPSAGDAIVGRLTAETPQLGFDAQPRSVPGGGPIELVLANEGDVSASTGSWNLVLYRWDEQRWLPADDEQGWEEPSRSIEEVMVEVEPGDEQVIAHVDSEGLDPGWYGVYAKLQLGGRGGAVEVFESFEVAADGRDTAGVRQQVGDYNQTTMGDVRLWAHATPGDGSGEGAIVAGVLGFDAEGSCLFLERDGQRFPIVWPHGTQLLDDDPIRIGLADGSEATVGMQLEGGGGYDQAEPFAFEIPDSCVSPTGEVARFNQQSPIEMSE